MDVNQLYILAQDILNKNQNGYLPPDTFNLLINQGQISFLDYLLGEFQQYQYQKAQPRVQFSQNQTVRQRLSPLIYGYLLHVDGTGFSPYPGDYQQDDAMWTYYGFQKIKYVEQNQLRSYYNSRIDPYQTNPFYLIEDIGFRFYPQSIGFAQLNYVRTPPQIVWGYTLDGNGRPVYNPATSVQPIWYETDLLEILARLLRMVGVSLQINEVSQYAEEIKNKGQ